MNSEGRRVARESGTFLGATWIGQVFSTARAFVVARVLAPERFGLFQLAVLVFEYARSAHGGLLHGMTKETSRAVGAGDDARLHRAKDNAFTGAIVLGTLALLGVPLHRWLRPDASGAEHTAVAVGLVGALVYQAYNFHVALLRTQRRIPQASAVLLAFQIVYGAAAVIGAWRWGLNGVYGAFLVSHGFCTVLALRAGHWRFRPAFDRVELAQLFRRGFGVVVVTFLFGLLVSLDRLLVAQHFGLVALGIYSLSKRAAGLAASVAESVRWVTLPSFLEDAGRSRDPEMMGRRMVFLSGSLGAILPPLLATAALLVAWPLEWFLPDYVEAVGPARVLLLGAGFLSVAGVPRSVLVSLDRERFLIGLQLVSLAMLYVAFSWVQPWGLSAVAAVAMAIQGFYAFAILSLSHRLTGIGSAIGGTLRILAPQVAVLVVVLVSGAIDAAPSVFPVRPIPVTFAILGVWGAGLVTAHICGTIDVSAWTQVFRRPRPLAQG